MNKVVLMIESNPEYQEVMSWLKGTDFGCEPINVTGRFLRVEYSFKSAEDSLAFLIKFGDKRAKSDLST